MPRRFVVALLSTLATAGLLGAGSSHWTSPRAQPIQFASPAPDSPDIIQPGRFPFWVRKRYAAELSSGIVAGPDQAVWITDQLGSRLIRVAMDGSNTGFSTPNFQAHYIATGADGRLWMTGSSNIQDIAAMTTTGLFTTYTSPSGDFPNGGSGLAVGPDRRVWFAENAHIAGVDAQGKVVELSYPSGQTQNRYPAVTRGSDGRIWFTELNGVLGALDVLNHRIREYQLKQEDCGLIFGLAAGGDGNMYATCRRAIYRVSVSGETLLRLELPHEPPTATSSTVEAPDGNVWVSQASGYALIDVYERHPAIRTLRNPFHADFTSIATGPDGNMWGKENRGVAIFLRNAILVNPHHLTLKLNQTKMLAATYREHGAALSATSADPSVASVTAGPPNQFAVSGHLGGTTTVTISDGLGNSVIVPILVQ